ncbi:M16 family metallopeptidase [Spirilliplanes yamanashiensis]|uniref:Peptidase M16 n=1 Tax=Spirilliplanes yamanashiensis TaxID=42233 RepID=A0A8J4DGH7_9ACTN|nr:pitrilysin family protein [Spirilliplanes yamanashiensis]MDP9819788.1 putative Zn-dependent peptidase [Spirilliplanes yamanashiensis]GIJ01392.1 peptidase M16 [Spirilliplanes yamanashiensis]
MTLIAERPGSGAARPYRFPDIVRRTVAGGRVVAAHLPGQMLASASLLLDAGAAREPAGREGAASVLAKALEEGTTKRDATAYALALEGLGAELSTSVDWDAFRLAVGVPVGVLPAAVELMAEAARTPLLDPAEVSRVRDDEVTALKMDWAQPGPRADAALRADLFDGRYGRPLHGDPASTAAVTADDVAAFHADWFLRPGTLLVAGDLDVLDLDALAAAAFAGTSGDDLPVDEPLDVPVRDARRVLLVDRPGSVQSTLRLGHRAPHRAHPDYVPMSLAATVLGGAFTSRLNHLIREVRGYTYGIRGDFGFSRRFGRFSVSAAVQTAVTAPALADTVGEISRTRATGVTEDELAVARTWRAGQLSVEMQTPGAIAGALATLVLHGLPDDYHATLRERLLGATVEEVSAAARTHLHPDGLTVVVEGDAAVLRDELVAANVGEVVDAKL